MSSLTKAIKSVHLAQQLKSAEFDQFLSKLATKCGRDFILSALFTYITSSKFAYNQTENIIEIISDIMQSRKDNKLAQLHNITINNLNCNIIGKISSYLNQKDYIHFSTTTRSIFVGCNSPNALQKINLDLFNSPYSFIDLQLFPMVKSMEFYSENFSQINFIPNDIQHLRLNDLFTSSSLEKFMKLINFDNMTTLCFKVPYTKKHAADLWAFFSKFSNVKHLELDEQFDEQFTGNQTENLFPNLKSFSTNGSQVGYGIIDKYSNKLQGLKFDNKNGFSLSVHSTFEKLNELRISNAKKHTIDHILKSGKNLRK
eukprot:182412_1